MHYIPILDDVFLAFQAPFTGILGAGFAVMLDVVFIGGDFGADETFFEIGVDHTGGLGGGGTNTDGPGAHFLLARREVGLQTEQVEAGTDDPVQARLFHAQVGQEVGLFFVVQLGNFRFDLGADRHHGGIFLFGQFAHGVQQGVVLKAAFVHVGDVHGRLQGQQVQALDGLALIIVQIHGAGRFTFVENRQHLVQYRQQAFGILVLSLGGLGGPQVGFFHRIQVGQGQLGVDHGDVVQGGHLAGHMDHVFVIEAAHHMGDGIGFTDIGQKLVAQAFALGGPGHQPGDIHEFHGGGHDPFRADNGGELVQTGVWHRNHTGIGLNGAEREVLGINPRFGQRVEQGGFAHVGQTDDTAFETHNRPPFFEGAMLLKAGSKSDHRRAFRGEPGGCWRDDCTRRCCRYRHGGGGLDCKSVN